MEINGLLETLALKKINFEKTFNLLRSRLHIMQYLTEIDKITIVCDAEAGINGSR
jgi:hypothetical protein